MLNTPSKKAASSAAFFVLKTMKNLCQKNSQPRQGRICYIRLIRSNLPLEVVALIAFGELGRWDGLVDYHVGEVVLLEQATVIVHRHDRG
jgi:hypothetical protein